MIFGRDDWTLFRNLNTLGQKAGVPKDHLAALAVKELADNALDTGATCKVGEMVDGYYFVEDNGPGIDGTDEYVATLFSVLRPLTSSKLFRLPTRGALGNGLRVVAGTVLASGGALRVQTKGRVLQLTPQDNGHTAFEVVDSCKTKGTRVEIKFGRELYDQDALWMSKLAVVMRGDSRYEGLTSPHWYDSDAFFELLQAASITPISDLVQNFDGGKKWTFTCGPQEQSSRITRDRACELLTEMRKATKPPKTFKLGVVGEFALGSWDGYAKKYGEFDVYPARGSIAGKIPAVIEVWAEKLDKDEDPQAQIFVNRTPITAKVTCWHERGGKMGISGCGLSHYFKTGRYPMRIYICVTAPYMPITTDGKEPNLRPLVKVITDAISSAARKAKIATSTGRGTSKKTAVMDVMEEAREHASGGGKHRFSLRQLFYAVRPLLQEAGHDEDLNYNYFATVVTDYEASIGRDVPGMYRDTRRIERNDQPTLLGVVGQQNGAAR